MEHDNKPDNYMEMPETVEICDTKYKIADYPDYIWCILFYLRYKYEMDWIEPGDHDVQYLGEDASGLYYQLNCDKRPRFLIKFGECPDNKNDLTLKFKTAVYTVSMLDHIHQY